MPAWSNEFKCFCHELLVAVWHWTHVEVIMSALSVTSFQDSFARCLQQNSKPASIMKAQRRQQNRVVLGNVSRAFCQFLSCLKAIRLPIAIGGRTTRFKMPFYGTWLAGCFVRNLVTCYFQVHLEWVSRHYFPSSRSRLVVGNSPI